MTNYTTLNIINKLLLEKLERLENDNKELKNNYERLEKKTRTDYNELYSLKHCVDLGEVVCCIRCIGEMWYHYDDTTLVGDWYVCDNCWDNKRYFRCDNCDCSYCEGDEDTKIKVKTKSPSGDYECILCENCWDEERKRRHKNVMDELISQSSF